MNPFPRDRKFLLGDRIRGSALDVLERLIEAAYSKRREEPLTRVNLGLEKLRYFCRLAHALRGRQSKSTALQFSCMDAPLSPAKTET